MEAIMMYRHGDVLLIYRGLAAEGAAADRREIVLAQGEVTGHAHRLIGDGVSLLDLSNDRLQDAIYVDVPHPSILRHEEHRTLSILPGRYEVRIQQTMTQLGRWERVRD